MQQNKKTSIYSFGLITLLAGICIANVPSAYAQAAASNSGMNKVNTMEMRTNLKTAKDTMMDSMKDQKNAMKASSSALGKKKATVMNADLTAITGTTLSITKDGKTYTVTTSATTKFRRNFGGESTLAEFSVGNKVDVSGTWTDTTGTTLSATSIRNRSIMKRRGVFIGEVLSKTGNTIVLKSKNRENQTVTLGATTKYVNKKAEAIKSADVLVGHMILVKGMWDKSNNTLTQVTQLKDFSLPMKAASISAMPAAPATPSATTNL